MKSKIETEKIKAMLPHGAITKIAKNSSVSLQTVHCVLNGTSNNIKVMNAIADYLIEFQKIEKMAIDRLASLTAQYGN